MTSRVAFLLAVLLPIAFIASHAENKMSSRLASTLSRESQATTHAWVFFTDKGASEALRHAPPTNLVSERSLRRRMKVRPANELLDYTDLPVEETYVAEIAARVTGIRHRSKWMNAVSIEGTAEQIWSLVAMPFVASMDIVYKLATKKPMIEEGIPKNERTQRERSTSTTLLDYGASFAQLNQINVPAIHDMGNYGQGVIVGVFDNGFRLLNHQTFNSMNILATYDFVDNKVSVVPNNPSPTFGAHGVNTLSTIGGYSPGQLIGPAFGATYILARTENDSSETPAEEDKWVAGIEWMDSLGVEVTSTSLGYLDYDPPYPSWTWQNMDGNTTVITRAADLAVSRGIVVVNSAGNEGFNANRNTLIAPADGDSVLAVGAVNASGVRSGFSSVGPTTSIPPRIKPDIMARGSSVVVASATNPNNYGTSSGTSFSCPLAAGVAALMLHAHPTATPMEIVEALKTTASNAASPNNTMGWGIINAVAAIGVLTSTPGGDPSSPVGSRLHQNYPNPFNPSTTIRFSVPTTSSVTISIYNLLGQRIRNFEIGERSAGTHSIVWNGLDDDGNPVASGAYVYRFISTYGNGKAFVDSKVMILLR